MRLALVLVPIILTVKVALGAGRPSWFPEKACEQAYLETNTKSERQNCYKPWTVLIFMGADNDLSPYSYWDLYEMERKMKSYPHGASSLLSDVVVEWDNDKDDGIRRIHVRESEENYDQSVDLDFFKKADPSMIKSPVVAKFGERDFTIKQRLKNFLEWGIKEYPAKNYMVVIWGHGEGYIGSPENQQTTATLFPSPAANNSMFLNESDLSLNFDYEFESTFPAPKNFGGVALDYSDLEYLDIPAISDTLEEIRILTLEEEKKIDILAFDACLMQSLEVAFDLKDSVEFLVGSDQIQNYLGMPYKMLMSKINNKLMTPYEFAKEIPTLVEESFSKGGYQGEIDPEGQRTFTVSSINLAEMELLLLPALADFSDSMIAYIDEKTIRKLELGFILDKTPSFQGESRDIGIFMGSVLMLLHEEAERNGKWSQGAQLLYKAANNVVYAINRATMSYAYGTMYYSPQDSQNKNYLLGFFKGLSAWIPKSGNTYKLRKEEFEKSNLFDYEFKGIKWQGWLEKIYDDASPFPF